jgi:hypothetical protein
MPHQPKTVIQSVAKNPEFRDEAKNWILRYALNDGGGFKSI